MPTQRKSNSERCDLCGAPGVKNRRVTRTYGRGADLLVIEDVPVKVCPACGGSYLTSDTLHELERIKLHRRAFAKSKPVPVAKFVLRRAG